MVRIIIVVLLILLGLATLIPLESVSKECLVGYRALCSFTPVSTFICLAFAALQLLKNRGKNDPNHYPDKVIELKK